jgi:hypothetical protein
MSTEAGQRESFLGGLLQRPLRRDKSTAVVDHALDVALQRLAQSLNENEAVGKEVKRRQSSGSLKAVLVSDPTSLNR